MESARCAGASIKKEAGDIPPRLFFMVLSVLWTNVCLTFSTGWRINGNYGAYHLKKAPCYKFMRRQPPDLRRFPLLRKTVVPFFDLPPIFLINRKKALTKTASAPLLPTMFLFTKNDSYTKRKLYVHFITTFFSYNSFFKKSMQFTRHIAGKSRL